MKRKLLCPLASCFDQPPSPLLAPPTLETIPTIQGFTHTLLSSIAGGGRRVMVIVVGNGHGDTSSNPGRD